MKTKYIALPTNEVDQLRTGKPDANDQQPEKSISDGNGNPCRHCLSEIPRGEEMLILGYRPFRKLQPYAEVGPIFICANSCVRHQESNGLPELYRNREMLIRGYDINDRIVYGTGKVVPMANLEQESISILENPSIAYIHVRSSTNNCYHFRIDRAQDHNIASST